MKRIGGLYERVVSQENLYLAYLDARKNKRGTHSCHTFEKGLGAHIARLSDELASGSYAPLPYNTFTIHEPKPRLIMAPAFRDRVVQHSVYRVVREIFDRSFIAQSYACRLGKGTHAAADYAQRALQQSPKGSYLLQLDIRRFYYSIDRDVLRALISKKIKDVRLVALMMAFANSESPQGVPIGNLLSQLYGLIYLNPLDHYCKRVLKAERYCRYVDDFIIFGVPRAQAIEQRAMIVDFLRKSLKLELSKSTVAPISRGSNFVGYRTWASRRFVRRRALFNFRRAVRLANADSAISALGHAKKTASLRHMLTFIKDHNDALYSALPKKVRRIH